ncbi:trichohyalin [Copidosoma floridanum]|uniref:trichohyalin n=1 Tax=Copidosoma floridanum TaxID=29053 RepID=UPI0006C959E1|nr:trichohyalin [Copidosoma floridanum]
MGLVNGRPSSNHDPDSVTCDSAHVGDSTPVEPYRSPRKSAPSQMQAPDDDGGQPKGTWATISQLATANRQLAASHGLVLEQCRVLVARALDGTGKPQSRRVSGKRPRRAATRQGESKPRERRMSEGLARDLEHQRLLVERLTRDLEESERQCREKDESLEELRRSGLERARLLETFQCEEEKRQRDEEARSNSGTANEEFRRELALKREARQRAIAKISSDMEGIRSELEAERQAHSETTRLLEQANLAEAEATEHVEVLRLLDLLKVSDEVSLNLRLQLERTDDLRFRLESDAEGNEDRIGILGRMGEEGRERLRERRRQTAGLKDRLAQLLTRLAEAPRLRLLAETDEIRREAESQLGDIARARQLCDERSRMLMDLREERSRQVAELRAENASLAQDKRSLEEELGKTEDKVDSQDSEILSLESQLGLAKADCRDLQNQMTLINSLFSQMLLGASSLDLDRLTRLLQENHDLITGMAKEKGTEAAALPKLLLDIVEQVDGRDRDDCDDGRKGEDELQEESIADNLPKVWRILLELLSCQQATDTPEHGAANSLLESSPDSCYKSVDTPTGPQLVISVSKTYIRLKELILEKKLVEKEMNRMKQLNSHLETKLSEQEQRLSIVSSELSKTWNVVGRMQAQHQQLHTHEKILRYELQQKRKILQELKQELEYCRVKWESARQKNTNTEIEWNSLRREFAARKALVSHASAFSNSGESGFSDEREEESDEEDDRDVIGKRVRPRRRSKKDGARVMSPDTESELPTDTEFSESKVTSPSTTSGQQTPAPAESDPTGATTIGTVDAPIDPLDKALAEVIEDLLETDEVATPVFSIGPIPVRPVVASGETSQFGSALPVREGTTALDARAARLKSLEEQAEWLVRKVNDTNRRGSALSTRLEELHEAYGPAPVAPPMPDVLPVVRLQSELVDAAAKNGDGPREAPADD